MAGATSRESRVENRSARGLRPRGEILLIVDLQRAFPVPEAIVGGIRQLTGRFSRCVFTRFVNPEGSLFRKLLQMDACPPGSPDTRLLLAPRYRDIVLTKQGYGLSSRHVARLRQMGVRAATVCGIDTDACVLAVMFTLFDAGIDCRVVPDLCWSSSGSALHRTGLRILARQFPPPRRRSQAGNRQTQRRHERREGR